MSSITEGSNKEGLGAKRGQGSLIIGILIGLAIGGILCTAYAGSYIVWQELTYPELKVMANQWSTFDVKGVTYGFRYQPDIPCPYNPLSEYGSVERSAGRKIFAGFVAKEGHVLVAHPLRITVLEVRPEYVILHFEVLR